MKNKDSESGESIFKKKGFFIALYSCLGSVMVLAVVISFSSLTTNDRNSASRQPPDTNESINANADTARSYLESTDDREEAWRRSKPTPMPTATPKPTATPTPKPPTSTPVPTLIPTSAPQIMETPVETAPPAAQEPPVTPTPPVSPTVQEETEASPVESGYTFIPFADDDKMIWPVQGELAMTLRSIDGRFIG